MPCIATAYLAIVWATSYINIFIAKIALWSPLSASASISLKSTETCDTPKTPDFLFKISSISSGKRFSFFIIYVTIDGSKSPERVPIGIPPSGVNPIDVSTDLPFWTAHILAPWPKWQLTIFKSSIGTPLSFATLWAT